MKQRILSLFCALALCLSLLPATALADEPTDNWEDVVTSQPEGYTVDTSGNVTISSAEGLAWLSKQSQTDNFSGKTVTLTEDIDLSGHNWTPIGPYSKDFRGTFDGQNHTITGLTIVRGTDYAGLFTKINGGTVKNVRLAECSITRTSVYTAGICGLISSGTIENCHILSGSISKGQYTGGICGQCSSNSKVSGCSNAASISSGSSCAGGICADAENDTQIINCTNSGTVTASGGSGYVGGICGTVMNSSSVSITGCVNTGAVEAEGANHVGGICGATGSESVLSDCLNTGYVKGKTYVGGICGDNYYNATLSKCLNTGAVSQTGTNYMGAITGSGKSTDCYYLEGGNTDSNAKAVSQAQLESGEVAWLLQDGRDDTIWGQLLSGSGDPQPSDSNRVVKITVVLPDGNTSIFYANVDKVATGYPDGYAFFADEACSNKIDTSTKTYSEDTTIYAKLSASTPATVTTAPAAKDLTYNGSAQALVTAGEADGGTMVYRLGTDGAFTDQIPTAADAGSYTVYYYAQGDDSHSDTESVNVTISQAPLTVTAVTAEGKTYDGSATVTITDVTLDGVCNNDDVSVDTSTLTGTLTSANVGTYNELTLPSTLTLTGAKKDNYTLTLPAGTVTVTDGVTISKAPSTIQFNNYAPSKTYDGQPLANPTADQLTITGAGYDDVTFTWYKDSVDEGTKLDSVPKDAGTYYLVASIPDSTSTTGCQATSDAITITAKPVTLSWSTTTTFTYDGSEHSVTAEVTNAVDGDSFTLTYDDNTYTNVGNFTATVTGLGNSNYTLDGATGITHAWSITAAAITDDNVTLSPDTATFNGTAHALTVLVDGKELSSADYDLSYKDAGGNEVTELIDVGTYEVTVTGKGNYTDEVTLPYNISPAALTITDATIAPKT